MATTTFTCDEERERESETKVESIKRQAFFTLYEMKKITRVEKEMDSKRGHGQGHIIYLHRISTELIFIVESYFFFLLFSSLSSWLTDNSSPSEKWGKEWNLKLSYSCQVHSHAFFLLTLEIDIQYTQTTRRNTSYRHWQLIHAAATISSLTMYTLQRKTGKQFHTESISLNCSSVSEKY